MEKKNAIEKYSFIFLLLSFGVLLTTFILSRNDCAQIQETKNKSRKNFHGKNKSSRITSKNMQNIR